MHLKILFTSTLLLFLFVGNSFEMSSSPPPSSSYHNQMFDRYVAIGDSLTHGFQSGAVDETRQAYAWPAFLAKKMNTEFIQPLLRFPGHLVNIEDIAKNNISWWEYYYVLIGGERVDDYSNQSLINNFGITGADITTIKDYSGSEGGFYELVLGQSKGTAIDQALNRNPTFISLWLGNNDVLGSALHCDLSYLTELDIFEQNYLQVIDKILAKDSIQGVVVANIPDVTCIAYLDDANNTNLPAGSVKPFWLYSTTEDFVLTPDDLMIIQERTNEINEVIFYTAVANGWAFVDTHEIFLDISTYGHDLKNSSGIATDRVITSEYLGGLFSLDGVHPSITGHAVAANYMIDAINDNYLTNLDYVDEYQASEDDSLYNDPVDPRYLVNSWIGQAITFVINTFI